MSNLSVLQVCHSWGIGGTQKAAATLIKRLNSEYNFGVHACGLEKLGPRAENLEGITDPFVIDGAKHLREEIRRRQIDIVHLHVDDPTVVDALEEMDIPVVKTAHFGQTRDRLPNSLVDHRFFVSRMILLRSLLLENRALDADWTNEYSVSYNPVDIDSLGGESLREQYDIAADTPVIGKIGRSAPEKWGSILVDAFALLANRLPEARLLLIGTPTKIQSRIRERGIEGQVIYVDPLPVGEVGRFYETIDVLAHSSGIGESFGYVIAEAMASRVPVVVDSTPLRDNAQIELVDHGRNGYVANGREAYADALERLLTNKEERRSFGRQAEKKAAKYHSSSVTKHIVRWYESLAVRAGSIGQNDRQTELPDQKREQRTLQQFAREYDRRLEEELGTADLRHRGERSAWRAITKSPVYRRPAYEFGRKAAIFLNEYVT